mmetsp:Transcript_17211/g.32696  ORF Transcript_17211/g.32696 Transcript_17211/m.32696 type:complete len:85 (+) Transcript_17211:379-633(+)
MILSHRNTWVFEAKLEAEMIDWIRHIDAAVNKRSLFHGFHPSKLATKMTVTRLVFACVAGAIGIAALSRLRRQAIKRCKGEEVL